MTKRVLAVASAGGHLIQLERVLPAFEGMDVALVTTVENASAHPAIDRAYVVADPNRWTRTRVVLATFQLARICLRERPHVVFSTGAAIGCIALILCRLMGARTIWLDSIANVLDCSLSARIARPFCGLWLTQWPEVAERTGATYAGGVL